MTLKKFLLKNYSTDLILELLLCLVFLIGGIALLTFGETNRIWTFLPGLMLIIMGIIWTLMTYNLFNPALIKTINRVNQIEKNIKIISSVLRQHGFSRDPVFELLHPHLNPKILSFTREKPIRRFPFGSEKCTFEIWALCQNNSIEIRAASKRGTAFLGGKHYPSFELQKIKRTIIKEINQNKNSL